MDKNTLLGTVSVYELLKYNSKISKLKEIKNINKKYNQIDANTKMADYDGSFTVCVEKEKILGVVKNEK